jgi:hypothetical protein
MKREEEGNIQQESIIINNFFIKVKYRMTFLKIEYFTFWNIIKHDDHSKKLIRIFSEISNIE